MHNEDDGYETCISSFYLVNSMWWQVRRICIASAQAKLKLESIKMNNNFVQIYTESLMSEYSYFINSRVRIIYGGFTKSLSLT